MKSIKTTTQKLVKQNEKEKRTGKTNACLLTKQGTTDFAPTKLYEEAFKRLNLLKRIQQEKIKQIIKKMKT